MNSRNLFWILVLALFGVMMVSSWFLAILHGLRVWRAAKLSSPDY